ncbi:hypothetical protein SEMRO_1757_G295670.1 [Seminavis robusta]|uniref:Uncharacterized protein n=1 Tax=Seminavis robusta TaxID=568900 RepID=A0A9N8HUI4_9STRA|nr:hypothetical protein SEMRO_1757_G295670.1 [Seminavis robusta]|eukprot:Sro1757_g295670.1 n/a (511) ;mRNA; f:15805-17799
MGKERKPNFTSGLWVKERAKPYRHGQIICHHREDGKRYTWLVRFEEADGTTTDVADAAPTGEAAPTEAAAAPTEAAPTAAVAPNPINQIPARPRRRAAANHKICPTPAPVAPAASSPRTATTDQSSEPDYDWSKLLSSNQSDSGSDKSDDDKSDDDKADNDKSDASSHSSANSFPIRSSSDDDSDNEEPPESTTTPPIRDPSAGNLSNGQPTFEAEEALEEDVNAADERDFEYEEEHREKMILYKREKQELLDSKWTVEFMPDKPPMPPNASVKTKGSRPRFGKILRRAADGIKWVVEFDGQTTELSSHSLIQIWEPKPYEWKIVENSQPDVYVEDYGQIGLAGFEFGQFDPEKLKKGNKHYGYPYLKLLQRLWPGDPEQQRRQINLRIDVVNGERKKANPKNPTLMRKVSKHEFWKFIGILSLAAAYRVGGHELFEQDKHRSEWTITEPINLGVNGEELMPFYRFKDVNPTCDGYPALWNQTPRVKGSSERERKGILQRRLLVHQCSTG